MALTIGMEKCAFKLIDAALKRGFIFLCVPKTGTPNTTDRSASWFSQDPFTPTFRDVFLVPTSPRVEETSEADVELAIMTAADDTDWKSVLVPETPHVVTIRSLNEARPIWSVIPPLPWATMANEVDKPPSVSEFLYHFFFVRKGSIGGV